MPFDAPQEMLTALATVLTTPAALVTLAGAAVVMLFGRAPMRQVVPVRVRPRRRG